nr:hypothetical protein [Allomuricauda sp.]
MDADKTTQQKIDQILESASTIEAVGTPSFFKDKVLKQLTKMGESPKPVDVLAWFVPKYQMAALVLFMALNLVTLYLYTSSNEQEELETFAETYLLTEAENSSILN